MLKHASAVIKKSGYVTHNIHIYMCVVYREMKHLKETVENNPNFKFFYDRKLAHASSRESQKFLHENLTLPTVRELVSTFNCHFS